MEQQVETEAKIGSPWHTQWPACRRALHVTYAARAELQPCYASKTALPVQYTH